MAPYLPPNPVIVEAGANDGEDTLRILQMWPNGRIYAFEPLPRVYQKLLQAIAPHPNITAFPLALGDRMGLADFYISRHPGFFKTIEEDTGKASSLLLPERVVVHTPLLSFDEVIQVPITTLDAWAEEHGVDRIDFMWLDMQGCEGMMLKAAPKILQTVKALQIEFTTEHYYKGSILFDELDALLRQNGFKCIGCTAPPQGDAWYVRR